MRRSTKVPRRKKTGDDFKENENFENSDYDSSSSTDVSPGKRKYKKNVARFQAAWLSLYKWLKYDAVSGMMECKYCDKFRSRTYKTSLLARHGNSTSHKKREKSSSKTENSRKITSGEVLKESGQVSYSVGEKENDPSSDKHESVEPSVEFSHQGMNMQVDIPHPPHQSPDWGSYHDNEEISSTPFPMEHNYDQAYHWSEPDYGQECDYFGRSMGAQLKMMNYTQKCIAQRLMSEICFRGQMQILQIDTTLATSATTYEPPPQQLESTPQHGSFYSSHGSSSGFHEDMLHLTDH